MLLTRSDRGLWLGLELDSYLFIDNFVACKVGVRTNPNFFFNIADLNAIPPDPLIVGVLPNPNFRVADLLNRSGDPAVDEGVFLPPTLYVVDLASELFSAERKFYFFVVYLPNVMLLFLNEWSGLDDFSLASTVTAFEIRLRNPFVEDNDIAFCIVVRVPDLLRSSLAVDSPPDEGIDFLALFDTLRSDSFLLGVLCAELDFIPG